MMELGYEVKEKVEKKKVENESA